MEREEFYNQFNKVAKLKEKEDAGFTWLNMSPRANKANFVVSISGIKEVNVDYLYYIYNNIL